MKTTILANSAATGPRGHSIGSGVVMLTYAGPRAVAPVLDKLTDLLGFKSKSALQRTAMARGLEVLAQERAGAAAETPAAWPEPSAEEFAAAQIAAEVLKFRRVLQAYYGAALLVVLTLGMVAGDDDPARARARRSRRAREDAVEVCPWETV